MSIGRRNVGVPEVAVSSPPSSMSVNSRSIVVWSVVSSWNGLQRAIAITTYLLDLRTPGSNSRLRKPSSNIRQKTRVKIRHKTLAGRRLWQGQAGASAWIGGLPLAQTEVTGHAHFHALLIEADEAYDAAIAACMRVAGCDVQHVADADLALSALERNRFDVVVWGVPSPDPDGRHGSIIAELRLRTEAPLVLLAAGFETAQRGLEAGAGQRLPKPFIPGALVGAVRAALRRSGSTMAPLAAATEIR